MKLNLSDEVAQALSCKTPVVALESTVIAHGLPHPHNIQTALEMEQIVRNNGGVPATIAIFDGEVFVGLDERQIERLAVEKNVRKISRRDLAIAIGNRLTCATTVATTTYFAHLAGIKIFATGGIGGVHRGYAMDVSADLPELAQTPITVICSGAKIVLDVPATREWLETNGVTTLGWQCDFLPGFYTQTTGLPVDERVDTPAAVERIVAARDRMKLKNSILVAVPVPKEYAIDTAFIEEVLVEILKLADKRGIRGKEITPFLLGEMVERSGGKTLAANIALLKNNASVAAKIAQTLYG